MEFLAHRGLWYEARQKNTLESFRRAWQQGFGIETDFRVYGGKLVISHDIPKPEALKAVDFFEAYLAEGRETKIAVNIKEDGLQSLLLEVLQQYNVQNYFVFDMSIPDMLGYLNKGFGTAVRLSEYEVEVPSFAKVPYVWVDCFIDESWISQPLLERLLSQGKRVALVSPELHRRDPMAFWEKLKSWGVFHHDGLMLCTDFPEKAKGFFYERN